MQAILSIDQSTAGTKGLIFHHNGKLLARADVPHRQITNELGWVEHDPTELFQNTCDAAKLAIAKANLSPKDIAAISLSNQRETAVCWDRESGQPLYNAIVWQCVRAVDVIQDVERTDIAGEIRHRTGLQLSPFFSAAKFGWMIKHVPAVAEARQKGTLCCGTIDSWLIYKLTGAFRTDYSNASRTQLLNLHTLQWDEEIVQAFGIDLSCLPQICFSDNLFGETTINGLLPHPIPIHGVMGDSHAALFGNNCHTPATAKVTYGTGSSVMMNVGTTYVSPGEGVSASLAWGMNETVEYVLEGNVNYTGAVTKWLVDDIGLLPNSKSASIIAQTVDDTGGVYLVPAFSGLGAPYFNSEARAAFLGMQRGTTKAHLLRAAEECIAYQIKDVVEAMNACHQQPMSFLHADGGPTNDTFLMQFQSDILDIPLKISTTEELSGLGAAYCAAIGAGLSEREALFANQTYRHVQPKMEAQRRKILYDGWKNAVNIINRR